MLIWIHGPGGKVLVVRGQGHGDLTEQAFALVNAILPAADISQLGINKIYLFIFKGFQQFWNKNYHDDFILFFMVCFHCVSHRDSGYLVSVARLLVYI